MAFPKELLAEHEEVVLDLRPHWVALLTPALWTIGVLVLLYFNYQLNWLPALAEHFGAGLLLIVLFIFAVTPFLRWRYTMFVLTTDRLITRHGVIAKHSKEIPLENINDVAFSQSVIERMVGAGDLLLESAGERGQTHITNVRNPEAVQLTIYKTSEENSVRMMSPRAQVKSEPDIPSQIAALARLHQEGAITAQEYELKKSELLKRI